MIHCLPSISRSLLRRALQEQFFRRKAYGRIRDPGGSFGERACGTKSLPGDSQPPSFAEGESGTLLITSTVGFHPIPSA
jgi:hypothetical protein